MYTTGDSASHSECYGVPLRYHCRAVPTVPATRSWNVNMPSSVRSTVFWLALGLAIAAPAAAQSPDPQADIQHIIGSAAFKRASSAFDLDYARIVDECVTLSEIPAPAFKEGPRAQVFARLLREAGLQNVQTDAEGNVYALRRGAGGKDAKLTAVSAHLDTSFADDVDTTVKRTGTKLAGPGVGEDAMGLAAMLAFARALDAAEIKTRDDILFIATVGKEGLGDLRGVRFLFAKSTFKDRIKQFIALQGADISGITNAGLGSKRYRVTFSGPGGPGFNAFGLVNPLFALAEAANQLSKVEVPASPRTTYNIGMVGGGTSITTIPQSGWMEIDMRSESIARLKRVEERMLSVVAQAADTENGIRSTKEGKITVEAKLLGDRPAGQTDQAADIVQFAEAALTAAGYKPTYRWGSTDANVPMSLGVPSIALGVMGPGKIGRTHNLDEWIDVDRPALVKAMSTNFSVLLATAGVP
jgi:acetylornithine deacetylase/succinyl-diaminopimelate desuccinylase-like protein